MSIKVLAQVESNFGIKVPSVCVVEGFLLCVGR